MEGAEVVDVIVDDEAAQVDTSGKRWGTKRFTYNNKGYSIKGASEYLCSLKSRGGADWWDSFEVVEVVQDGVVVDLKLKCIWCAELLTVSNPSGRGRSHMGCCKAKKASTAAATTSTTAAAPCGTTYKVVVEHQQKRQRTLHGITGEQQQRFMGHFSNWWYKSGISFNAAQHKDLKDALAVVGLVAPTSKDLAGKLLTKAAGVIKDDTKATIKAAPLVQLSTDGWRRNNVAGGVPLINVMALLPSTTKFWKVHNANGDIKDAQWLRRRHTEWASEVSGGDMKRITGMVMDNTKANRYTLTRCWHHTVATAAPTTCAHTLMHTHTHTRTHACAHAHASRKAMKLLEGDFPWMILLGCLAHALALLLKDLGDSKKGRIRWITKVYDTALMMSNTINGGTKVCALWCVCVRCSRVCHSVLVQQHAGTAER
jgi:hypothetical protein